MHEHIIKWWVDAKVRELMSHPKISRLNFENAKLLSSTRTVALFYDHCLDQYSKLCCTE